MIFGFTWGEYDERLKPLIDRVIQSLDLGDDAVTTFFPYPACVTESCNGTRKRMPYIRVCSTGGAEEVGRIVQALKKANLRVDSEKEFLPPDGFIPAEQMQDNEAQNE